MTSMWNSQTVFKMSSQPDILRAIIQNKRLEIDAAKSAVPIVELRDRVADTVAARGFERHIRERLAVSQTAVVAECKKASPSKGVIREDYDVQKLAESYEKGGAACLSVLTDEKFFRGSLRDLETAASSCSLPLLRKDFIVDAYQIYQSRASQADCILLIVSALDLTELIELGALAKELGMDVLVEVHSHAELEKALELTYGMIGINNRNLRTFETSLETSIQLCQHVPDNRIIVSESGIHTADDVNRLRKAGIETYLVGESLMKAVDPGTQLAELFHRDQKELTEL